MRCVLRLSAAAFAACNAYHLTCAAGRLVGLQALRDACKFDPEDFRVFMAEEAARLDQPQQEG